MVTGEFPAQRPVTLNFDVLFDLRLNKRSSKPTWGWWFETPSCSLWRHSNGFCSASICMMFMVCCVLLQSGNGWFYPPPSELLNTLRPRQNGRHFPDDIFKCIFLNKNVWISIKISQQFVPEFPIDTKPSLVQIMAWRRPGDKALSEPMLPWVIDAKMHI